MAERFDVSLMTLYAWFKKLDLDGKKRMMDITALRDGYFRDARGASELFRVKTCTNGSP